MLSALQLENHPALLCSIHTFGKAAGCHGAVVACASRDLKEFFINYARPFIYSTCLDPHSLVCIKSAYTYFGSVKADEDRAKLFSLVRYFRDMYLKQFNHNFDPQIFNKDSSASLGDLSLLPSPSPIQSIMICGNERCKLVCQNMRKEGFDVYPIRAPTVPVGQERIRVVLHVYNTPFEVDQFVNTLISIIFKIKREGLRDIKSRNIMQTPMSKL